MHVYAYVYEPDDPIKTIKMLRSMLKWLPRQAHALMDSYERERKEGEKEAALQTINSIKGI